MRHKIRILFIDARGDLGGGSNHLAAILHHLDPEKFEAFTASPSGQPNSEIYRKHSKSFCSIPFRQFSLDAFRDLAEFAEINQVHFIHSHGRGAGIYSRLLHWKTGIPAVHTFHGISYGFFGALIDWLLARWTARFVHVSDSEKEFAVSRGVSVMERAVTIPNGIDFRRFQARDTKESARQALGISADDFVVGCVARFDACKRHIDLLKAVSQLSGNYPNLKLIFAGSGETEPEMRNLAYAMKLSGKALFLGELPNPEEVYAALDVFILPSEFEGLPLAPLEAMAAGCAVILSNVRGNRDIVQDEKDGLLFEAKNISQLAAAMERLINGKELRLRLIESAHRTVIERFSAERMCAQIQKFYESLVPLPEFPSPALAHDWLFHMRGGEKVLEAIGELFPLAPIYTLFSNRRRLSGPLNQHQIYTSWLNVFPSVEKYYRYFLPLLTFVIRQLNTRPYQLLISSSHCAAKAIRKGRQAVHICYCHTPMRYAWGYEQEYFGNYPPILRRLANLMRLGMRRLDIAANDGVDFFIANSINVKDRIKRYYGRDAEVIYPPIRPFGRDSGNSGPEDGYFLIVSACVPYKRVDLAIDVFNELKLPLVVIGSGPLLGPLRRRAEANIRFLGWQPDDEVARHYAACRALIFPTDEDFGMVPLEAMMYGKPVIALRRGGALETVVENETGIFFERQEAESLRSAVEKFLTQPFDSERIIRHAMKFDTACFKRNFRNFLDAKVRHGR